MSIEDEITRLNFEDFLWFIFALLCFLNIKGDADDKEYIKTNNNYYKDESNKIFEFTLIITSLIYIYFFFRNYIFLQRVNDNQKQLYSIKLLGSSLLLAGVICLIYFQVNNNSFIGSPAL